MSEGTMQTDPSSFRSLIGEYAWAVTRCGVIERPDRALIEVSGTDAVEFLQGMVSADVKTIGVGSTGRAAILDTKGHILADLRVHRRPDAMYLETDASRVRRVQEILNGFIIMEDVKLTDRSFEFASISLVGPKATYIMPAVAGLEAPGRYGQHADLARGGWVVNAQWPGLSHYDVWAPIRTIQDIKKKALDAEEREIGPKVAEMLRVESGEAVWGKELTEDVLLPEAEIPGIVSYTKGCYVGQEIVARIQARGHTNRALRRLIFSKGPAIVVEGSLIYVPGEEREVARITSAVRSVRYGGQWLALGYVRSAYAGDGTTLRGRLVASDGSDEPVSVSVQSPLA